MQSVSAKEINMYPNATLNPTQQAHVLYLLCRSNHPLFTDAIFPPIKETARFEVIKKNGPYKLFFTHNTSDTKCVGSFHINNQFSKSQDNN